MNQNISLPDRYRKQLREESQRTGQSMSEIIRRALDAYFAGGKRGKN